MCQENLQMPCEEFTENSLFPENVNKMQEEIQKPVEFQQESGFEYNQETLEYLIRKEYEYSPNGSYFQNLQKNITPYMRAILLDWMMEVCNEFTLKRETFHLAVNYVDRILSAKANVLKNELQLIGVVSMFIASKIEVYLQLKNEEKS
jgi:cyclin E